MKIVGDKILAQEASWTFEGDICHTFDDHVAKSVPLYNEGHQIIVWLARYFLSENSICYDIGSSTGVLIEKLNKQIKKDINYIGIEPSKGMYDYATSKFKNLTNINFINSDILEINLEKNDLVISYFTLQFIKQVNRQDVVNKIYNSLNVGGAFILYEKTRDNNPKFNDILAQLYIDFKTSNGYSDEEILAKQRSLIGVMDPNTVEDNYKLLQNSGFTRIVRLSKYLQFEGLMAFK